MKKMIIFLTLVIVGTFGFAETVTQSLYFGDANFMVGDAESTIDHWIGGIGYREITSPHDTGFYYGSDLFIGAPMTSTEYVDEERIETISTEDMYAGLKIPLGYRWPGENKRMGFYLGGGPAVQVLADFDNTTVGAFGGFVEIGWETNKTSGVGLHIGLQMGGCSLIYDGGDDVRWNDNATLAALQLGMSWRRIKDL